MSDSIGAPPLRLTPTAQRPLLGLTILVVEDSRFASEAMRLMCLRSGARIRRADSLAAARRHLAAYRPAIAIIDLGLPDGPGEDLISELANAHDPISVLLATSGDDGAEQRARAAGARGFLAKPMQSLCVFQETLLSFLPPEAQPKGPRLMADQILTPDPMSFRDDMAHVAELIDVARGDDIPADYIAQFVGGVARAAGDNGLISAVKTLATAKPGKPDFSDLRRLVNDRLCTATAL